MLYQITTAIVVDCEGQITINQERGKWWLHLNAQISLNGPRFHVLQ